MSDPAESDYVRVTVETELGAVYEFPDVHWRTLWVILRSDTMQGFTQLSLVNLSQACMVIPVRIIKRVRINGDTYWEKK